MTFNKKIIMKKIIMVLAMLHIITFASSAKAAEVVLQWDAPTSGATPAGYKIYQYERSGAYRDGVDVGNTLTYTATGLDGRKIYYWTVTAYDAYGFESSPSNEVSVGIGAPTLRTVVKLSVEVQQ